MSASKAWPASPRPPGPRQLLPGLALITLRLRPLSFLTGLARDYGDVVCFKLGGLDAYLLNHPDAIREVLVTHNKDVMKGRALQYAKRVLGEGLLTSEGDFNRRQRRLVQPAFHRQRLASYATVMTEHAVRVREQWEDGQTVDIAREMMALALAIVGQALFSADVEEETAEISGALTTTMEMFNLTMLPFAEHLERFPLPQVRRFKEARARLDATIYRMIEQRRDPGDDRDLLALLMRARDTEEDGGGMTDQQVRDEAMTLFLAGHETTANALAWTWYLLSLHPGVEERLHQEIDDVLAGRLPTAEDMPALKYTEMVLAESMRLYPPAWIIGRRALQDIPIDRYVVPAGSLILISQYVVHRDARYYPEPAVFNPDRWTPEGRASRPRFAYFPFSGGARQCIGEGFAWMEGILLIATLAQQWRMRLAPDQKVSPRPLITLRPRNGIRMVLERR